MILEINNEEEKEIVTLVFKTKTIVNITKKHQSDNFDTMFFKAVNNGNVEALANIIMEFADGNKFNNDINKVYDFLDKWKKQNNKTYNDLFMQLAKGINDEGFFLMKMTEEQIQEAIKNPLSSVNLQDAIMNITSKIASEAIKTEEFKGYKA